MYNFFYFLYNQGMKKIQAVIFDMDGVILDSESVCDKIWESLAEERRLENINRLMNLCRGLNRNDTISVLKKSYGKDFDGEEFLNSVRIRFRHEEEEGNLKLMPQAKECLDYLKPRYRLCLASSTSKESVFRQLKKLQVFDYFETLTTGDMVVHSKPDPEIYRLACKSINTAPENCVAIEDSPNGIKSASAAGLSVIMIPDRIQPDKEIRQICWKILPSLKEISGIL